MITTPALVAVFQTINDLWRSRVSDSLGYFFLPFCTYLEVKRKHTWAIDGRVNTTSVVCSTSLNFQETFRKRVETRV